MARTERPEIELLANGPLSMGERFVIRFAERHGLSADWASMVGPIDGSCVHYRLSHRGGCAGKPIGTITLQGLPGDRTQIRITRTPSGPHETRRDKQDMLLKFCNLLLEELVRLDFVIPD
jgi:hypothetical protein